MNLKIKWLKYEAVSREYKELKERIEKAKDSFFKAKQANFESFENDLLDNLSQKMDCITNNKSFDAVYCIEENEWNGNVTLQLKLKDIK